MIIIKKKILLILAVILMGFGTLYRPALADSGWDSDYDSEEVGIQEVTGILVVAGIQVVIGIPVVVGVLVEVLLVAQVVVFH